MDPKDKRSIGILIKYLLISLLVVVFVPVLGTLSVVNFSEESGSGYAIGVALDWTVFIFIIIQVFTPLVMARVVGPYANKLVKNGNNAVVAGIKGFLLCLIPSFIFFCVAGVFTGPDAVGNAFSYAVLLMLIFTVIPAFIVGAFYGMKLRKEYNKSDPGIGS